MESEISSVRRVSVEDVPPRPRVVSPLREMVSMDGLPANQPSPPSPPPSLPQGPSTLEVVVSAFTALGYALSARALLLLGLVFSFVLAVMAMQNQTMFSLWVLIAGAGFSVLPVAYLEIRRRA
jgi:hypothetical protein